MANEQPSPDSGGVNTMLIVLLIIIVLVVGFFILRGTRTPAPSSPSSQSDINIKLPDLMNGNENTNTSGNQGNTNTY